MEKLKWIQIMLLSLFLTGMAGRPPLVGGPAPPFKLEALDGRLTELAHFKGKFVVLNFWATWCLPCIKEMPELQKAHRTLNGDNVKIIGVNFAESRNKVDQFTRELQLTFPILLDRFGKISQEYEILNLPVTYFISPDGIIRDKVFGGGIDKSLIESKIQNIREMDRRGLRPTPALEDNK